MYFLTHADVVIDPERDITDWPLSDRGRDRIFSGLTQPWLKDITSIWSSTERKALDTAEIIAGHLGLDFQIRADLGENDRSATGYLPPDEFERTANQFFAAPDRSVRGWARAVDEQRRIVAAFEAVRGNDPKGCPLVVSHGAVGALLMAHLLGQPISRAYEQLRNGGGNWFNASDLAPVWRPFDASDLSPIRAPAPDPQ